MTRCDEVIVHVDKQYKVLRIDHVFLPKLQQFIRNELAHICYGAEKIKIEPDEYTYRRACGQLHANLLRYDKVKRYGVIGELLMHILAPKVLDFNAESLSMVLALQNQNIKPGFDLNFHDKDNKKIWYGEVKSGLNLADRKDLVTRARDGLRNYFDNVQAKGKKSTYYRWEAAKNEVMAMFASDKKAPLMKMLSDDRRSMPKNEGKRKNALLMTVSFGDDSYYITDNTDIHDSMASIAKLRCFDDYILICVHRRLFTDIINFLKSESQNG